MILTMTRGFLGFEHRVTVGARAEEMSTEFRTLLAEVFEDAGVKVAFKVFHVNPFSESEKKEYMEAACEEFALRLLDVLMVEMRFGFR